MTSPARYLEELKARLAGSAVVGQVSGALIIVSASDAHLESKASALACRSKAEALDSSRPTSRLVECGLVVHQRRRGILWTALSLVHFGRRCD